MKMFTLKGLVLTMLFMAQGILNIHAIDVDSESNYVVVNVVKPGTLSDISNEKGLYNVKNLKLIGSLNGEDFHWIYEQAKYAGLNVDLSEVTVVGDGSTYSTTNGNNGIREVEFKDNVIPSYAFYGCWHLKSIILPSSIISIESNAFCECGTDLVSVTIPQSVVSIGCNAFYRCSNLSSITIPSGVTSIGSGAFDGCKNLSSISIPGGVTSVNEAVFSGCSNLSSITIPSGVTSIGSLAFYGCKNLSSIAIPSGVISIGDRAFLECSNLSSIDIPYSVTSIGYGAFSDCTKLQSVYVFSEIPPSLGDYAFPKSLKTKGCLYVPNGTFRAYWRSEWGDKFYDIVEFDATVINRVTTAPDVKEISRYSVNGQRLDAPTKGLNLVKYSDGSVKKVMVQ